MANRIYVGTKRMHDWRCYWKREVFRSAIPITEVAGFDYCAGPFRTIRGAKFAVHFGWVGNPHFIDVEHCERLAREFKTTLAKLPRQIERV